MRCGVSKMNSGIRNPKLEGSTNPEIRNPISKSCMLLDRWPSPRPSPIQWEREHSTQPRRSSHARQYTERQDLIFPLPNGEGRGEGEKDTNSQARGIFSVPVSEFGLRSCSGFRVSDFGFFPA